jgi:RimJ/RimL family protein N-acetyltransferase
MNIPALQTPHLLLRAWTTRDAEVWFNILHEEDILRYFPNPAPPDREKAEPYIAHHLTHWRTRGYGHWVAVAKQDGLVVGWCGLEYLPELDETEVAYLFSHRVWGRGYATEAARAAVRFGFESAGLEAITGLVHPDNVGSVRVLEKCGLTFAEQITLWGMGMSRYRITRARYEEQLKTEK